MNREILAEWFAEFHPKLKRTTTRTNLDKLLLSVERKDFRIDEMACWTEVDFKNCRRRKAEVRYGTEKEEWVLTPLEIKILKNNRHFLGQKFERSALKEENGEWQLDSSLTVVSEGGEALVLKESIGGNIFAVRVQIFDPFLFTNGLSEYGLDWHLLTG